MGNQDQKQPAPLTPLCNHITLLQHQRRNKTSPAISVNFIPAAIDTRRQNYKSKIPSKGIYSLGFYHQSSYYFKGDRIMKFSDAKN